MGGWVGGWVLDFTRLMLISTQVEVVVEVGVGLGNLPPTLPSNVHLPPPPPKKFPLLLFAHAVFFFKWGRISSEIDWYLYQGASPAPTNVHSPASKFTTTPKR